MNSELSWCFSREKSPPDPLPQRTGEKQAWSLLRTLGFSRAGLLCASDLLAKILLVKRPALVTDGGG